MWSSWFTVVVSVPVFRVKYMCEGSYGNISVVSKANRVSLCVVCTGMGIVVLFTGGGSLLVVVLGCACLGYCF